MERNDRHRFAHPRGRAGIAGLGAARALRQRGLAIDVVERGPAWTHTGAGIYLPGNAARMGFGRGKVYCYCDAPTEGTPRLRDDVIGKLAELLIGFAAPVPAILDTLGPDGAVHVAPIEEVTLDSWSQGSARR